MECVEFMSLISAHLPKTCGDISDLIALATAYLALFDGSTDDYYIILAFLRINLT